VKDNSKCATFGEGGLNVKKGRVKTLSKKHGRVKEKGKSLASSRGKGRVETMIGESKNLPASQKRAAGVRARGGNPSNTNGGGRKNIRMLGNRKKQSKKKG